MFKNNLLKIGFYLRPYFKIIFCNVIALLVNLTPGLFMKRRQDLQYQLGTSRARNIRISKLT